MATGEIIIDHERRSGELERAVIRTAALIGPEIETVLLDRPDLPSAGARETPIVALAPAIADAIVAAGGPRLRALPLVPNGDVSLLPS